MQLTVADIQKINVTDGETLAVFVDIANVSPQIGQKMMQEAAKFMRNAISNPAIGIIVVPAHAYSFGVISATNSAALGQPQSIAVGKTLDSKSGSADPQDAYDRAMKGLG